MCQTARAVLTVFFLITLNCTLSWAGVIPGRWEKVQAEEPGTGLIVVLMSGDRLEGTLREVAADALLISVNGQDQALPKSGISKVTTAERRTGPLWNGALIGGAVGGVLTAVLAAADSDTEGSAATVMPVILGVVIGVGIDAAFQSRITLYEAPTNVP